MAYRRKIMSWNVQLWGGPARNHATRVDLVAEAIYQAGADLVGIMELVANSGPAIGPALANALSTAAAPWGWAFSAQVGQSNAMEQYLYVYDSTKFTPHNALPLAYPQHFQDGVGTVLGFPNKGHPGNKNDNHPYYHRPPFRCAFQAQPAAAPATDLWVYLFHADSWAGWAQDGAVAVADIAELPGHTHAIVMGDFNLHPSDATGGGRAAAGFGPLIGLGYAQQITGNVGTGMVAYKAAPVNLAAAQKSSYDNFFLKTTGHVHSVSVVDVIGQCVAGQPLDPLFRAWVQDRDNLTHLPAAPASFTAAFQKFRHHFTDHLPILIDITI